MFDFKYIKYVFIVETRYKYAMAVSNSFSTIFTINFSKNEPKIFSPNYFNDWPHSLFSRFLVNKSKVQSLISFLLETLFTIFDRAYVRHFVGVDAQMCV